MNKQKAFLREEFKHKSRVVNRKEKEHMIAKRLCESKIFLDADIIFLYSSYKDEISTEEIAREAERLNKKTAFPLCEDREGKMKFYFTSFDSLQKGMYSINEPDREKSTEAYFTDKSLCIVPGLAFGINGERLGKGKGYYDRFLIRFKGKSAGLSFEENISDRIPMEEHDIKIDYLVTENKIYKTSKEE